MPGSMQSCSEPIVTLNTAFAESLRKYADALENSTDFNDDLHKLIRSVIKDHGRIVFNGNGYDEEWEKEAARRGLLNLRSTPDCVPCLLSEKNISLFSLHKVYSEDELRSRHEIKLSSYSKIITIEALTMINMARRDIIPAVSRFSGAAAEAANAKKTLSPEIDISYELSIVAETSSLTAKAYALTDALGDTVKEAKKIPGTYERARYCRDSVFPAMAALRAVVDKLERITDSEFWPYPTYGDLLFSIR